MFLPLVLVVCAFLQGDTGQLNGTVVDANGAIILGANVKLTSESTSQVRELVIGDSGNFAFTLLPPGCYKLEVAASGFRTVLIDDVRVNITQTTSLTIQLEVTAATGGELTITADPPLVQAESSHNRPRYRKSNYPAVAVADAKLSAIAHALSRHVCQRFEQHRPRAR